MPTERESESTYAGPDERQGKLTLKPDGEARSFYIRLGDVVEFADGSTYRVEKTSLAVEVLRLI